MPPEQSENPEKIEEKENKGKMTVSEAGRAGGKKTAATHGPEFYRSIGREGGKKSGKKRRKAKSNQYPDAPPGPGT